MQNTRYNSTKCRSLSYIFLLVGVLEQCCNPLTLHSQQSGGVGSIPGRAYVPLEHHDKGSQT